MGSREEGLGTHRVSLGEEQRTCVSHWQTHSTRYCLMLRPSLLPGAVIGLRAEHRAGEEASSGRILADWKGNQSKRPSEALNETFSFVTIVSRPPGVKPSTWPWGVRAKDGVLMNATASEQGGSGERTGRSHPAVQVYGMNASAAPALDGSASTRMSWLSPSRPQGKGPGHFPASSEKKQSL